MPKRKLVTEVASASNGNVKLDETFLNNLVGDTTDETVGKIELGPTMMDITKGLKVVVNKRDDGEPIKYTVMMYITRGAVNQAVQFFEIESQFTESEIIDFFFKYLKYKLPSDVKLSKGKKKKLQYFGCDHRLHYLEISRGHAYIYIGKSDGKKYENNYSDVLNFVFRDDPENKPSLCSIM